MFFNRRNYSKKLADLWQSRGIKDYELDDIVLLKVGRHLRPKTHFKVIIGREEGENNYLAGYRHQFISLQCTSHNGPLALIDGEANAEDLHLAARLLARFGAGRDAPQVIVEVQTLDGGIWPLQVNHWRPMKS